MLWSFEPDRKIKIVKNDAIFKFCFAENVFNIVDYKLRCFPNKRFLETLQKSKMVLAFFSHTSKTANPMLHLYINANEKTIKYHYLLCL